MKTTCHSDYGKIQSIFIKKVEDAFVSDEQIDAQWQQLNYLNKPMLNAAKSEYKIFEKSISEHCDSVYHLGHADSVGMDSVYCRDASIATDFGMIICRMGKAERMNEPSEELRAFKLHGLDILGIIEAPGTLEGGDVAWIDQQTLAVGHTYRTNHEGISQLKALLEPKGVNVRVVQLPHFRGPSDVFHLMSILSPIDKDLAVVYSALMPIDFRQELVEQGYELIELPEAEFDSMGCNVLALSPRKCLMVKGNPKTKAALKAAGCEVIEYKGEEISVKGGGGPTCLTRPIKRIA